MIDEHSFKIEKLHEMRDKCIKTKVPGEWNHFVVPTTFKKYNYLLKQSQRHDPIIRHYNDIIFMSKGER